MYRLSILFLVSSLLVGCGLTKPVKLAEERTYTLSNLTSISKVSHGKVNGGILLVNLPIASAGYDSNRLVYEPLPFDLRYFANHRWAAPPAQMILPLLAQGLRHKSYFKAVVMSPYTGISDYHLDSRLLMLKQSFLKPTSVVVLVLQEALINDETHRVVATRRFVARVKSPGNDPYSGVVAANAAVGQLISEISSWAVSMMH